MRHLVTLFVILLLAAPCVAQNVTLAWDLSADDALLGVGGGYRIYQSKSAGVYTPTPKATVAPGINTVTFATGQLGKLYFVATAFLADGTESVYSNEVTLTAKPKPPKVNAVTQVASAIKNGVVKFAGLFVADKNLRIVP